MMYRLRSRSPHRQRERESNRFSTLKNNVEDSEINVINDKPPPITVQNVDIVTLKDKLKLMTEVNVNQLMFKINSNGIKVFAQNKKDFLETKKYCKSSGLEFYTHALDEKKSRFMPIRAMEYGCEFD